MSNITLNPAQKFAVEHTRGPLLIVAGAGTGKTRVLTQKIAYLIDQKLATPEQILALTFTDKAANEMAERVAAATSIGYAEIAIGTFHSFCQRLLEAYGLDIGLPNQFRVLKPTECWMLVHQNLSSFDLDYYRPLANPSRHIHELISHFSKCKDELIEPADYFDYAREYALNQDSADQTKSHDESGRLKEVADAYHSYNQLLLRNNCLDFGDLIFHTYRLLSSRPHILSALRERYRYILVDEFQDVNWAQYRLVQLLAGDDGNLTVVGDDDQSIYAFRGASVSNILRFKDDYPNAKEIVLNENYRSCQEILDCAYQSIQNNNPDRLEEKLSINKRLTAQSKGGSVAHIHEQSLDDEAKAVVGEILRLKQIDNQAKWSDFAILVRANSHAAPFIERLLSARVPYQYFASDGLFRQSIVLDAVNYLKLIDSYHESSAVYRILIAPFWNFGSDDLQKLTAYAKRKSISYYEALRNWGALGISELSGVIAEKLLTLIGAGVAGERSQKPSSLLYNFFKDSGYLEYLAHRENQGDQNVILQTHQLKQFFDFILAWERSRVEAPVDTRSFLEYLNMMRDAGEKGQMSIVDFEDDSVKIMTVHASKGLEFDHVFVVNLVEDRFPARGRRDAIELPLALIKEQLPQGDERIEEERRLFYVASTRARKRLYFCSASDYGGARVKKISRFLAEIGYAAHESTGSSKELTSQIVSPVSSAMDSAPTPIKYPIPQKFSYSQIKMYETCPYHYKLQHILHLPSSGGPSLSFGQSLHSTLQEFYNRVRMINSQTQIGLFDATQRIDTAVGMKIPELKELLEIYESKWIPDWYDSASQREQMFAEGKKVLSKFYESNRDHWTVPLALESKFTIQIGDVVMSGSIDRIDQLPDGSLEIIDYKTGKAKDKLESDDKDQLLIYQIAATAIPEYRHAGDVKQLTFYYLNHDVKLSFLGNEKELEKLRHKVVEVVQAIRSGRFEATPNERICGRCDFRDICEFAK